MAGVQIPRVGRLEPQAPTSVGRMEVNVPNFSEAAAPASRGVEVATKNVMNAQEARENEIKKQRLTALDIKSSDESNQFEYWSKQKLAEIKLKSGDTTADYVKYDEEAQAKYKEVFSKYENMDGEFKSLLDKKLNNTYGAQQSFRNIQQSEQTYKYRDSVYNEKNKLAVDNFMNAGLYVNEKSPDTFSALYYHRDEIVQTRIAQGSQTGVLTPENQQDYMNTAVGVMIKKDMGDAVIPLVNSLNAAGKVKEGKKVIDDFSQYLNATDKAKLLSDNNESDVNNQAIVKLTELQASVAAANPNNPNRRVMLSDIEKIPDLSPAVRFKVIEKNDIFNKRQDAEQDRKMELLVSTTFEELVKQQAGPNAFVSEAEWINSPQGKNFMAQGPKPSDVNNMRAMVVAPTKSKASALEAFNQGVIDRNLWKMTPRDIAEIYPHLNKQDRTRFDEMRRDQLFDSRNNKEGPVTGDKISGMHGRMTKALEEQMKSFRDPKSGDLLFETNSKGKFSEDYDIQMLTDYNSLIRDDILKLGGKLTGAQENEIVNKRLSEMVEKRKEDHKSMLSKWFGADYKPAPRSTVTPSTMTPSSGAYGARRNTPATPSSSDTTTSLRPPAPIDTAPNPTPNVVVSPSSGTVSNIPPDSDRKSWILLFEQQVGRKFDAGKDIGALKTFRENLKKGR